MGAVEMKNLLKYGLTVFLVSILTVTMAACGTIHADDLMAEINPGSVEGKTVDGLFITNTTNFSINLLSLAFQKTRMY
jgi:hypothetical protein